MTPQRVFTRVELQDAIEELESELEIGTKDLRQMRRQLAQLKREGPPAYVTILNEMRDGISRGKPITRNDLWINTGLNRNTIDMAIKGLLRKGVITRVSYGIYRLAGRSDAPGQPPATSARSSKGAGPSAQL